MTLTEWKERGTKLIGLFRLNTSPVAVRLLGGGERLPKGAVRPLRDYGLSIAVCQAMGMARRLGLTVAMTPEDSECPTGTLLFGWAKMGSGEQLVDTWMNMCLYENRAAAAKGFEAQPRVGFGEYAGIVFSPLDKTKIEPDVVVLYCDTAQATAMMVSYNYSEGAMPSFTTQASAVCVDSVMPVLKNRQPKISIPCAGDRRYEMTQDNEILFSIPAEHVETVIRGMERRTSRGAPQVYPPARQLWFKPTLNPHYAKLKESLGKAK